MNKEQKKIKSRNNILNAAEKYFTEKGIRETDIDEVCRIASLTRCFLSSLSYQAAISIRAIG